jgi:hypothetical protein
MQKLNRAQKALRLAAFAVMASAMAVSNQAALDTNITGIVTDIDGFFDTITPVVIAVVVFGIAISYAKLLKKR